MLRYRNVVDQLDTAKAKVSSVETNFAFASWCTTWAIQVEEKKSGPKKKRKGNGRRESRGDSSD